MKKDDILSLLRLLIAPVLVILLGLVLIVNPDSASALISKVLGWVIIAVAVNGISAIFNENGRISKSICAVVLAVVGGWLVKNPLALAAWIGRIIGILLAIDGLQDIFELRRQGKSFLFSLIIAAVGVVLVLMPMTTSRIVFFLCGVVVLLIGVAMLIDRLKGKPRLKDGGDIIDAL